LLSPVFTPFVDNMVFPFKSMHYDDMKDLIKTINRADDCSSKDSIGSAQEESIVAISACRKKRSKVIDETLLPQGEAQKLIAKRAYNRDCAERARNRSKRMAEELYCKVNELQKDKDELRRTLARMEMHLEILLKQNKELILKELRRATNSNGPCVGGSMCYDQMETKGLNGYNPLYFSKGECPKLTSMDYHALLLHLPK
jgi:hypothetical protein